MKDFRYEIKFVLNENMLFEYLQLAKTISAYNKYPNRIVQSLYFDTINFDNIKDNLSGISNRNKLRLRWYSESSDSPVLEIKNREGRVGNKNKFIIEDITTKDLEFISCGELKNKLFYYMNAKFPKENVFNKLYLPVIKVNYNREYLQTNSGIRLTLDKNICFKNISLNRPIEHFKETEYKTYILEIKFSFEMKKQVSEILRQFRLTPQRHSKYLTGMSKLGYSSYI